MPLPSEAHRANIGLKLFKYVIFELFIPTDVKVLSPQIFRHYIYIFYLKSKLVFYEVLSNSYISTSYTANLEYIYVN